MKVISIFNTQQKFLQRLVEQDRKAQQELFNQMAPKMLAICGRYISDEHMAEDVMLKGFLKVFQKIHHFQNQGSLEGWVHRIIVNTCLDHLRGQKKSLFKEVFTEEIPDTIDFTEESWLDIFTPEIIQNCLNQLPVGCKTVLNLYLFENWKHQEIAASLNISEGTSKSQLAHAKKLLKSMLLDFANQKAFTQQN
ncbi:MAG: RNA polymerase sigma factor [Flavobacterium sp.]